MRQKMGFTGKGTDEENDHTLILPPKKQVKILPTAQCCVNIPMAQPGSSARIGRNNKAKGDGNNLMMQWTGAIWDWDVHNPEMH